MKRRIVAFDKDPDGDWRAALDCRHYQHVRHDPPLITREWVMTDEGRTAMLGRKLNCKKCDENAPPDL
jgi:hypothetical protein